MSRERCGNFIDKLTLSIFSFEFIWVQQSAFMFGWQYFLPRKALIEFLLSQHILWKLISCVEIVFAQFLSQTTKLKQLDNTS